jgi:sortase A
MTRGLRILSTALITAGLVVLADVGLTLAWQEPVSSLYGSIQQGQAEDELRDLESSYPTAADLEAIAGVEGSAAQARILARRFEPRVRAGHAIGRIVVPRMDLDAVVVEGTDTEDLQKGPGHYPETPLPGAGGTTAIAGHRTTYLAPFRDIDRMERGHEITVEMPYATFEYTVERTDIVDPSEVEVVRRVDHERLVLTACHPLYSAAERYVVFARLERIVIFDAARGGRWPAG